MDYESWGRFPKAEQSAVAAEWRHQGIPVPGDGSSLLPYGCGRSYGDSCLNDSNAVLATRGLNRLISFDRAQGVLRCESGVTLEEILRFTVPQGWFLPVTPGTKFVTVGGAIANDVHGKNHHKAGNFGHHVLRFELLRSDGTRKICSLKENPEWFHATIGGLGLTGLMTWVEFQLKPVSNPLIAQEIIRFGGLSEFFALSEESEKDFEYTVSWIDCLASGEALGRGLFIRGNHAPSQLSEEIPIKPKRKLSVPFNAPSHALNGLTLRAFNTLYYRKQLSSVTRGLTHYDPFFYPLDAIHHWNRIYGRRGFLQYQCVIPFDDGGEAIREILRRISRFGVGSFLAVLKTFGDIPSLGMLSFPRKGVTLALDFPMRGRPLFELLDELDEIVVRQQGAVYPAKDARMQPASFKEFFPQWEAFQTYIDPKFSSSFWRRVTRS